MDALEDFMDKAHEMILVHQDGLVSYVNPYFLGLTGFSTRDVIGRPIDDFIMPSAQVQAQVPGLPGGHDTVTSEKFQGGCSRKNALITLKEGGPIPVEFTETPLSLVGNKVKTVIVARELLSLDSGTEAFRSGAWFQEQVISLMQDLVLVLADDYSLVYFNEVPFMEQLHVGRAELLVQDTRIKLLHPGDRCGVDQCFEKALAGHTQEEDVRILNKGIDDYTWFRVTVRKIQQSRMVAPARPGFQGSSQGTTDKPLESSKGVATAVKPYLLVTCRNIDHEKEEESRVEGIREEFLKDRQVFRDFISNATHELKTPLTAIYGASWFLRNNYYTMSDPDKFKFIDMICRSSTRLTRLVNDMLDYSRLQLNKYVIDKEISDLSSIVRDALESIRFLLEDRNHEIKLDLPTRCMARVDSLRLEQVVVNLLSNAIKFTPPYGHVELKLEVLESTCRFMIKDDGVGFTKEEMTRVFKEFEKIDRSSTGYDVSIQGSGLGLFISKTIIEAHGGRIWMESEGRGKGSTFYFEIPLE